eukprot:TRINITY_DN1274_c1_g1_i6.p6 TRINITY_DN1274_c1_g1~~TRINITY_DN1274_c1_g1_i6.p6  ORF type:complete len:112 (-),score=12.15 TRINITY_DN1274_c1_g1_i6:114-449(-)
MFYLPSLALLLLRVFWFILVLLEILSDGKITQERITYIFVIFIKQMKGIKKLQKLRVYQILFVVKKNWVEMLGVCIFQRGAGFGCRMWVFCIPFQKNSWSIKERVEKSIKE